MIFDWSVQGVKLIASQALFVIFNSSLIFAKKPNWKKLYLKKMGGVFGAESYISNFLPWNLKASIGGGWLVHWYIPGEPQTVTFFFIFFSSKMVFVSLAKHKIVFIGTKRSWWTKFRSSSTWKWQDFFLFFLVDS